jgi:hypothetical protein
VQYRDPELDLQQHQRRGARLPDLTVTYTARKHGNMRVDEAVPYYEVAWHIELNWSLGNNTGWSAPYILGSFQLPWPGQAIAHLDLDVNWSGYQQANAQLTGGSPGPTQVTSAVRIELNQYANCTSVMPLFARWELPTVQSVSVGLQVYVAGGGTQVDNYRIAGSIRGIPS